MLATSTPIGIVITAIVGGYSGSLAALVGSRTVSGESIYTRSHCDSCGSTIPLYLNIPVVSWLLLRGRCLRCRKRIDISLVLIEVVAVLGWVGIAVVWGGGVRAGVAEVAFTWLLMAWSAAHTVHIHRNTTLTPELSTGIAWWYAIGLLTISCVELWYAHSWNEMVPWSGLAGGILVVCRRILGKVPLSFTWLAPGAVAAGILGATSGIEGGLLVLIFVALGLLIEIPMDVVFTTWIVVGLITQVWPIGYGQDKEIGVMTVAASIGVLLTITYITYAFKVKQEVSPE